MLRGLIAVSPMFLVLWMLVTLVGWAPVPHKISEQERVFWRLMNGHRRQHGLPPVNYETDLAREAHVNNRMGGYHTYVPDRCGQNWAWASDGINASEAFRMWVKSRDHNACMLGDWDRIGIGFDGPHATLNCKKGP